MMMRLQIHMWLPLNLVPCPEVLSSEATSVKINRYCIVFYPYIYIAPLAVHTNEKRFQCERPREKSAVLRERKEVHVLGSPVNKVDRVEGMSWFQGEGPMTAKACV